MNLRRSKKVAPRISWRREDLRSSAPEAGFDLVTAQFIYPRLAELADLHRRLAAAVRPGRDAAAGRAPRR